MAGKVLGRFPVAGKVFTIGLIILLLMIPLMMLGGLISERTQMRAQAYRTVADGWGGALTTGGPMLRIPFDTTAKDRDGKSIVTRHQLYVLPSTLAIKAKIVEETESRYVGIYKVPVYQVQLQLRGRFDSAALRSAATYQAEYHWAQAKFRLPISDVRTVRELSVARLAAQGLKFSPAEPGAYSAIEADVDLNTFLPQSDFDFAVDIRLAGSQALSFMPLAGTTEVNVESAWPDPQFQGAFLPAERNVSAQGFNAHWQVLELNRNYRQAWVDGVVNDDQLTGSAFGVELFQSVDVYQRSERAVKYALMFIALTFLSFYAWEMLSGTAIHPMQYLFIGLALSTFYLLLIALSEHVAFALAYWLGAGALVALLGSYIAGAFGSRTQGSMVGALMTLVYGLLYFLVLSENYALLMGAIALFAVLAVVMLATRKVKWYTAEA